MYGRLELYFTILDIYVKLSGQFHGPAASLSAKEPPVSIGRDFGFAPQLVWMLRSGQNSHSSAGNKTPAVQSVDHRYAD
jgi:hypothetical protein